MSKLIGCCGLDCGARDACIAARANDDQALEIVAKKWRQEYASPDMTAHHVRCDGCGSRTRIHPGWCGQCPVRACALEHTAANGAVCPDYGSDKVNGFGERVPQSRFNFEALRTQ
jgi:hypothetical protein